MTALIIKISLELKKNDIKPKKITIIIILCNK